MERKDFSAGWCPNCDAVNAPPNALLRADNLIHDELGVLALRQGSSKINGSPFADTDVHSLFTTNLSGTRYRMAGANNSVYANGTAIQTGMAGSDDIAFGFQNGQILFARSTSKFKYDGSTVRHWGITMSGAKPSAMGIAPDGKTLATGAEKTGGPLAGIPWFKVEGASPNGVVQYGPNHYDTTDPLYSATGAIQIDLAPTNRAVYEIFFSAPRDYSVYDLGTVGDDEDYVSLYVWCSDPKLLTSFNLQVDVNEGSFLKDWYNSPDGAAGLLHNDDPHRILPAPGQTLPSSPTGSVVTGTAVPRAPGTAPGHSPSFQSAYPNIGKLNYIGVRPPVGGPGSGGNAYPNAGWVHMQFKRSDFARQGTTAGKGWNSVKALRIVVNATVPDFVARVDTIRMFGGAITGNARWRYVYVRNASGYQALSGVSDASDAVLLDHQAAQVTVPADSNRDSQVNEIWLFRFDEQMDTYYRVYVKTGVSGTGPYIITDALKDRDALEANIPIQLDNTVPPDNIIGIAGPHFDRTLVLTSDGQLWPSRRLDPDAFATGQVIQVSGTDETPYWIFRALTDVFIGTSKDIYRLEGTGAENPDGSVDYSLRPMSIDHRPLNGAVAHEGHQLVFFSDDGWRASEGGGTSLLTGLTSELYRGKTRHGVSPVNVETGRFRAVLGKGQLIAITPEGASTTSSNVLYRYQFSGGKWYRHLYAQSGNWRSIVREPDGTVIAGDDTGTVWQLDTGTQDNAQNIAVTCWTKVDDLGLTYQRKKIGDVRFRSDTGATAASVAVHLDGSGSATTTKTANQNGMGVDPFDLSAIAICKQIQFRITGSLPSFHLYDYGLQFRERPVPIIGRVVEGWSGSQGVKICSGYVLKCNTLGVARVITPYLDGVADTETFTLTTSAEEPETHELLFTLTGRRATDISFAVDGEIEIDSWSAIVTQRQPLGVKVWDSGPVFDSEREITWLRGLWFKVRAGADLDVTPYFDGVEFPTVTIEVTPDVDTEYFVPVGRNYLGRQPRIVVKSCDPFYPYWVRAARRNSGAPSQKPRRQEAMTLETGA